MIRPQCHHYREHDYQSAKCCKYPNQSLHHHCDNLGSPHCHRHLYRHQNQVRTTGLKTVYVMSTQFSFYFPCQIARALPTKNQKHYMKPIGKGVKHKRTTRRPKTRCSAQKQQKNLRERTPKNHNVNMPEAINTTFTQTM